MTDRMSTPRIWSPLRQSFFRRLWIANVVSLVGSWMHEVGVSWLMTTLTMAPFMVAMVQTATLLPFFLLALPAGALADIIDRRRLLIGTQITMALAAAGLGAVTLSGFVTPVVLLLMTFFLSLGAAINAPAWQAVIPELVHRKELPAAVTLGSVAFNIARALGPALGGLVVAATGPGITFILNAFSFLGVMIILSRWNRPPEKQTLPEERLVGAMKTGIRYIRNAPQVWSVFIHVGIFSLFGSALWAFLPIVARQNLRLSSLGFGLLLAFFGGGGLAGAVILEKTQENLSPNGLMAASTTAFAFTIFSLAHIPYTPVICVTMTLAGMAWMIALSTFTTVVQTLIPSWVRGRVISVFMLIFFGALAGGSTLWGLLATATSTSHALTAAAVLMAGTLLITRRWILTYGDDVDLTPSLQWPSTTEISLENNNTGPVLVVVDYTIDASQADDFVAAMQTMKSIRKRDGALRWNLFRDITDSRHYIESFIVGSWIEHLRQHERFTVADMEAEKRVQSFQTGPNPPRVGHFVSESVVKRKKENSTY